MAPQTRSKAVQEGVRDAFDFWLQTCPISRAEVIGDAIKEAWKEWLEAHSEEIIQAIAEGQQRASR